MEQSPLEGKHSILDASPRTAKGEQHMSGGSLNYFYSELEDHANDFGDKELNDLVLDLATLFHDRDWFLSDDTCQGEWNEARDRFKEKWFTEHGRQERIEKYLEEWGDEIRQAFGMSKRYCQNCKNWQGREKPFYDGKYGSCQFHKLCLMHRSESCEKFEEVEHDDGG